MSTVARAVKAEAARTPEEQRDAILAHARHRAWQRHGMAVTDPELADLGARIAAGEGERLGGCAVRQVIEIAFRGRNVLVVFDAAHVLPITFLPMRARNNRHFTAASVRRRLAHERAAQDGPTQGD